MSKMRSLGGPDLGSNIQTTGAFAYFLYIVYSYVVFVVKDAAATTTFTFKLINNILIILSVPGCNET